MLAAKRILFGIMILAGIPACGESGSDNALQGLSSEEKLEFSSRVESLTNRAGFPLLVPGYLPSGMDPIPETEVNSIPLPGTVAYAEMLFSPAGGFESTDQIPAEIRISELPIEAVQNPGCPADDCEKVKFGDLVGGALEIRRPIPGHVAYDVYFISSGLAITVGSLWRSADESTVSQEMKEEILRVAESMIPDQ